MAANKLLHADKLLAPNLPVSKALGRAMTINYLKGHPWSEWTRDERYFCSVLYSHAVNDVQEFASWLIDSAQLDLSKKGAWDLGFEVCLYRDYLWQLGRSAKAEGFPPKRTFDFCLFGDDQIIVVEAKVFEKFTSKQNEAFDRDKNRIRELPQLGHLRTAVVALASSRYFSNAEKYGWPGTLAGFDGRVSWAQAAEKYGHLLAPPVRVLKGLPGPVFTGSLQARRSPGDCALPL